MQQWQVGPVPEYIYSSNPPNQPPNDMHHYQSDMSRRPQDQHFSPYGQHAPQQPHHAPPPMSVPQPQQVQQPQQQPPQPQQPQQLAPSHQQHQPHQQPHQVHHPQQHPQHQPHHPPQPQQVQQVQQVPQVQQVSAQVQPQPTQAPRGRKRAAPHTPAAPPPAPAPVAVSTAPPVSAPPAPAPPAPAPAVAQAAAPTSAAPAPVVTKDEPVTASAPAPPPTKKSRTNTPWTPAEEHRLKQMRDAGNSWAEIAKTFPTRTEGSVKKHWYKDMHYAEFAEDESQALLTAIKEYENNKWKVIGQKVGKPAKACEQYAKEHFPEIFNIPKTR